MFTPPVASRSVVRHHPPLWTAQGTLLFQPYPTATVHEIDVNTGQVNRNQTASTPMVAAPTDYAVGPMLDLLVTARTNGAIYVVISESIWGNGNAPSYQVARAVLCPLTVPTRDTVRIGGAFVKVELYSSAANVLGDYWIGMRPC